MKSRFVEILQGIDFGALEIEDILAARDEPDFDARWRAAYEQVESRGPRAEQAEIDQVRETAYKHTFAATGDPDLAAVVSDDWGLIVAALLLDLDDEWIRSLAWEYKAGRLPAGPLAPRPGKLRDILGSEL